MAFKIAVLVISWNTILLVLFLSNFNSSARCQEMASPSRSSSLANQTISALLAKVLNLETNAFLSAETSYLGLKPFSTSTPISFEGKSAI